MKWFFEDEDKIKILQSELDSWIRTPYRHMCGVKGLGCDCIHFVVRVFENPELGVVSYGRVRVPKYNRDWHLHHTDELLYNALRSHPKLEEIYLGGYMEGDILLHKFGRAMSHSAIYSRGKIFHSMDKIGVTTADIDDPRFASSKRRKARFRVLS